MTRATLLPLAFLASACSAQGLGGGGGEFDGQDCFSAADCASGLVCRNFTCVSPDDGAPPEVETPRAFLEPVTTPGALFALSPEAHARRPRHLLVRANGSDDVLALEVTRPGGALSSSVNFLFFPGARNLADLLVPDGDAFDDRVVALYGDGTSSTLVLSMGYRPAARALEGAAL